MNNADKRRPTPAVPTVRASDAERDAVAELLNAALAEGRLDPAEHAERLDAVYAAKTRAELEPVVADLPADAAPDPSAPVQGSRRVVDAEPTSRSALVIMSGAVRDGEWVVPRRFTAASVMGHVEIDLREARFTAAHTTIQAHTLMGSVEVIVPDDVVLRVEGVGVMGAYWLENDMPETARGEGAPVVTVTGVSLMGAAWGGYQPREHQKPPKKKRWWHRKRAIEE
jgi:hypothetical protein